MYGFVAVVFDGHRTAGKALDTLMDYDPAYGWIDDVAVVSRGKLGATHVHSTWAEDDSDVGAGAGWGLLTGGLIGALLGPGGALAGAAIGGSLGVVGGATEEIVTDDPRLDDFAAALDKNTSALILVGETPTLADFGSVVEPLGGKIIRSDLDEKDIKAIRKGLKHAA